MKQLKPLSVWFLVAAILLGTYQVVFSGGAVEWFPISDIPHNQSRPGLAYASSTNQFLVVWEDFRGSGIGNDVYAQLVDADGTMSGGNFSISSADDWQRDPKAAFNPVTGRYLVVWEDWRTAADNIYGQLVNADGSLEGVEIPISTAAANQSSPEIVYNPVSNQFLVVFDDDRLVAQDLDIYGVLLNADGTPAGADFPIASPAESQLLPVVAHNTSANQFLVAWEDNRNPATSGDIYARLVNADGTMAGPDFPISTDSADQTWPDVAYDSASNQYLVVWQHGSKINGRLVEADASFAGPEFQIGSSPGSLSDPSVGFDPNSQQFLVVWSDSEGWDDLYGRLVSTDGSMPEPKFDFATGKGDFFYPDVAINPSTNHFLAVWRHETCYSFIGCDDNDIDIYGGLYQASASFGLYLPLVGQDFGFVLPPAPTSTPTPTLAATPANTPTPTPTSTPGTWVPIMTEDFEGTFPSGAWTVLDNNAFGEYYWGKRDCRAFSGSYSGWAVGDGADGSLLPCGSDYPSDASSWMFYGPFSLADATAADFRLKAWVNTEPASQTDQFDFVCPMASTDGNLFAGDCVWGDSAGWIDLVLDLANVPDMGDLRGKPSVWVGLWFTTNPSVQFAEGVYVDDLVLRKCTHESCSGSAPVSPTLDSEGLFHRPAVKTLDTAR